MPENGAASCAYCNSVRVRCSLACAISHWPRRSSTVCGHHQVRRLLPRLRHALVIGARHGRLRLVLRLVRQQFRHFDLRQQLSLLDRVALVHRQCFQIPRHFGVKGRFLVSQDAEGGQRDDCAQFRRAWAARFARPAAPAAAVALPNWPGRSRTMPPPPSWPPAPPSQPEMVFA